MIIALISALGVMILILGLFGLLILLDRRMEKREKSVLTDTAKTSGGVNSSTAITLYHPPKTKAHWVRQWIQSKRRKEKALDRRDEESERVAVSESVRPTEERSNVSVAIQPGKVRSWFLEHKKVFGIASLVMFVPLLAVGSGLLVVARLLQPLQQKEQETLKQSWSWEKTRGEIWEDWGQWIYWITTTIIALVVFFAFWRLSKLFKKSGWPEGVTHAIGNTCRRVLKYNVGSTTLFRFFATGLVTLVIMIGVHFLAQIYWPDSWNGWRRSGVELFWIPNLAILLFFPLAITFRRWGWLPALAIVGITVLGVLSSLDWLSSTTSTDNGRHRSTATQPSQPQEWLSIGELRGKQSVTPLRNLYYDEYQLSYDIWYPDSRGKRGSAVLKRCIEDGKYHGTFEYRNPSGKGEVWLEEIPDRPGHFRGQSWSEYTNGEKVWFEIRPK